MADDIRVEGAEQLEALARRLKSLDNGRDIRKQLTRRLGAAVKPVVPELRAAINEIPSDGSRGSAAAARAAMSKRGGGSLRAAMARGVQQKTSLSGRNVGVRLRLDTSKLPADQHALPQLMNGNKPWRHPLFGDKEHWYSQEPHPFWMQTITPHIDEMREEVSAVLTDITRLVSERE